uniref:Uncharacterized protein n=1 Tax=Aegilops tauschii TaxID=37682 RepID=M8C8Y1_AEGTA
MRGIGAAAAAAAARRHAHLPSSYAAAFSSFSGIGGSGGAGRGRGRGLPPSASAPPRAPGSPIPEDDNGVDLFAASSSAGRGRGEPVIPPSPTTPSFSSFSGAGRGRGSPLPPPPPPSDEDAPKQPICVAWGGRGGRGGGRDGGRGRPADVNEREKVFLGDNADGEKFEKRLGPEKMKIWDEAFDEAADEALPEPIDDALLNAIHTNNMIEFEPEYNVSFANPDIEEKPPMSLEEMLQKVKPFIVAYEGIQDQEEWESPNTSECARDAVKDIMLRAPHMKELIDMYSGPDVVTAIQQEGELQRVANTLPENIPNSVKRCTDKTLLSLKNNPGWGFDKKCQFMDKFVREVSEQYK